MWFAPPLSLEPGSNEVHVWRVELDPPVARVGRLEASLSADERERADRFYFAPDRLHFVVTHGALRRILGHYLAVRPEQVVFRYNAYGKPAVLTEPGQPALDFNLSHSGDLALIAVTWERAIGVDVERIRAGVDGEEIAARFFSPQEAAVLRSLPAEAREQAFFTCWTRKEAFIKAKGDGLSLPLDQFDVTLTPGEPAALLRTGWDPAEAAQWSLRELDPGPGYVGAVAVTGHQWQLKCWQWAYSANTS